LNFSTARVYSGFTAVIIGAKNDATVAGLCFKLTPFAGLFGSGRWPSNTHGTSENCQLPEAVAIHRFGWPKKEAERPPSSMTRKSSGNWMPETR